MLPTKKLTSTPSRPTTAGLAPSAKSAAEKKVDAIVEEARAKATAKQQEEEEKLKASTGGTSNQVVNRSPVVDPDQDLSVEDLEEAIYTYLAQADMAQEAMDANTTVEQLTAAKEAEERKKAEAAATEAAKSKYEQVTADTPAAPSGAAGTPAGGVKRSSSGVSAPSSKRRRKPVVLGTRDG